MHKNFPFCLRALRRLMLLFTVVLLVLGTTTALPQDASSEGMKALHAAAEKGDLTETRRLLATGTNPRAKDDKGVEAIHLAAINGHLEVVRHLLSRGVPPDAPGPDGMQPTLLAVIGKNVPTLKLLIEAGAPVDSANAKKFTLLHAAAASNSPEMLRYVMGLKTDVNSADTEGKTPLAYAAGAGDVDAARLLLAAGARATATQKNGLQPLHNALVWTHDKDELKAREELVRLLLAAGAPSDNDVANEDRALVRAIDSDNLGAAKLLLARGAMPGGVGKDGNTLLYKAAYRGQEEIVAALLATTARGGLEGRDKNGKTPLLVAVERNHGKAAPALIAGGAKVDAADSQGMQALHYLSGPNAREIAKALVSKGARIDALDGKGLQPIHRAAERYSSTMGALLAAGANPSARTPDGALPLHLVAATKNEGVRVSLMALVLAGADVTAVDRQGLQPIHVAAAAGLSGNAWLLYLAGADPYARTPAGDDAFALLRKAGNAARATDLQKLIDAQKKTQPDLKAAMLLGAVQANDAEMVSLLVAHGYSPEIADDAGKTALDFSLEEKKGTLLRALLSGPTRFEGKSTLGVSLCAAVERNLIEAAAVLLEKGVDAKTICRYGSTPVLVAIERTQSIELVALLLRHKFPPGLAGGKVAPLREVSEHKNALAIAKLLIAAGANANERSERDDRTPLIAAVRSGEVELVKLLLVSGADPTIADSNGENAIKHAADFNTPAMTQAIESVVTGRNLEYAVLMRERRQKREEIRGAMEKIPPAVIGYRCEGIVAGLPENPGRARSRVETIAAEFDACATEFSSRLPRIAIADLVPSYRLMDAKERELADKYFSWSMSDLKGLISSGYRRIAEARADIEYAVSKERQAQELAALQRELDAAGRDADRRAARENAQFWNNWGAQMKAAGDQALARTRPNQLSEEDKIRFYARIAEQQEDPNSELNRDMRREEERAASRRADEDRKRRERQETDARRDQQRVAQANTDKAAKDVEESRERTRQANETAKKDAEEKARREERERERVRLDEERREREAKARADEERRVAEAKRKADAEAQERKERDAKEDYLRAMTSGIKLAATQDIAAQGDSGTCWGRETAIKMATSDTKHDAREECRALGRGWTMLEEKFPGYTGCEPCKSLGSFKCKITQAVFTCTKRD